MGISDKLKQLVQSGINAWNGDNGESADLKAEMLKQEVQAANIINKMRVEEETDKLIEEDLESAIRFQQQAEEVHKQNIDFIRNTSRIVHNEQLITNADEERAKYNEEIQKELKLKQLKREQELNKVRVAEGFNFYKVKDNLESGLSLRESLDAAGCIENNQYKLDYDGRGFIRLPNEEVDNVSLNVRQNIEMIKLLKMDNSIVILTGFPQKWIYSIGLLTYDKDFGFLLLKNNRGYDSYPTSVVYKMEKNAMFDGDYFDKVALCKTYMKIAGSGAFCYNIDSGLESQQDYDMFKEMKDMNRNGVNKLNYILNSLGLGELR